MLGQDRFVQVRSPLRLLGGIVAHLLRQSLLRSPHPLL
jgi:hypothetical protein